MHQSPFGRSAPDGSRLNRIGISERGLTNLGTQFRLDPLLPV